ncbi:lytic transglycosylase domain-containing protein [Sphingomonas nostoxanthinifaciens]|uniref:lytic transglycosylase domain-containing protein n=1 Tax=Sphingomonas nostoxanthinifaciens TaxID=2872652 RepID=UPI002953218A|nr:lytic transglycosylase domain-containing protein [Sphingomonas nostoxanthinifaciens]UAK25302.1 lytic transglycosylase domain-containing protein [Sphingomonas nostoxanthinifaciens]
MRVPSPIWLGAFALLTPSIRASAQPAPPAMGNACVAHVPEAASRSGLSADILLRVMRAESGGNARIVSVKGAMGCMQIMPATWTYLTARYNLGTDPFDARRNMIGGAMYLAELAARYGMAGALAAYNAGPGRYERYAAGAATLPAETVAYTARIGGGTPARAAQPVQARWQEASLFLDLAAQGGPVDPKPPAARRVSALFPLSGSQRDGAANPPGP